MRNARPSPKALRGKRLRFAQEYLVDLNGTQAAIRAGYGEKNARSTASELLALPEVEAAVARLRAARSDRTAVTADRVVAELAAVAFADIRNVVTWNRAIRMHETEDGALPVETVWSVDLKTPDELPPEAAAALAELSLSPSGALKVKMHSKVRALELLARHLGLLEVDKESEKPAQLTPDNVVAIWEKARARARSASGK